MTPSEMTHEAVVTARTALSPHLTRITLTDTAPPGVDHTHMFRSTGVTDEFVALTIPCTAEPVVRYYTIRAWRPDSGEIDIDFVLHGHGPASTWAEHATPGDTLTLTSPRGHFAPPATSRWIGLIGDATALPAIARTLEQRCSGPGARARARAVIAVDTYEDRLDLQLRPGDSITWVTPDDDLAAAATALADQPDPGYLWFSGEAAVMRTVRGHLRRHLRRPIEQWTTMAYWRRDSQQWRRQFDSHGPDLADTFDRIFATDDDPETQRDQAEALLDRYGL